MLIGRSDSPEAGGQMHFEIRQARQEDVFKDIVRVNENYRSGIDAGLVCKITHMNVCCYAIVRGTLDDGVAAIEIDERLRDKLLVKVGHHANLTIAKATWFGEQVWAYGASDPAYRVATRLALISFALGIVGLILGVISLFK